MAENQQFAHEEEIDLVELFRSLARRKWLIFGVTTLTTLLSLFYVLSRTPIYVVKSNIEIGTIDVDLIAEPRSLVKTLKVVFNVDESIELEEEFISRVSAINYSDKLPNFLEIVTEAVSNDEALKLNQEVLKYIQDKYKPLIEQYLLTKNIEKVKLQNSIIELDGFEVENLKRSIERIQNQAIASIDQQISFFKETTLPSLEDKIRYHSKKLEEYSIEIAKIYNDQNNPNNLVPLTVSSIQIVNYQNLILNSQIKIEDLRFEVKEIKENTIIGLEHEKQNLVNDELRKLKYQLNVGLVHKKEDIEAKIKQIDFDTSKQQVKNSELVGSYVIKNGPAKPKKGLILALGFVLGFMMSIFLGIFLDFTKKLRDDDIGANIKTTTAKAIIVGEEPFEEITENSLIKD